ncbi:MAG: serine/threonine protein kinase [Archangium sp.]|nr:serine/threonine protein kinase [Archangium sp.]
MPPKVIGPYRVLETLGSGGVGTVYRAIDRRSGDVAALKLLSTGPALDPKAARRLAREFETLQHLSHPNVVKVYDTGVFQGYPYLAMELVEGLTLRHYLSLAEEDLASDAALQRAIMAYRGSPGSDEPSSQSDADDEEDEDAQSGVFSLANYGDEAPSEEFSGGSDDYETGADSVRALADMVDEPDTNITMSGEVKLPFDLPPREERPIGVKLSEAELTRLNTPERVGRLKDAMLQLCEALAYIHGYGLIHRDLKPSNVMVDEDRTVRLMDFGLAKYISDDAAVTADGRLVGTFRYMAPEQILGEKLDTRTDLYSLGVILYELLAGRPPFEAKTPYELWQKVLETEAAPINSLNSRGDRVLSRVAHRLIRKEPDDRFQTAEEVYEALIE